MTKRASSFASGGTGNVGEIWPARNYAWYVIVLLTLAYALAILDRVSIALLIEPLQAAMHINDMQFGLLQGMAFSLIYSVLGLPIGLLCDRWKRVPILVAGLALWSVATAACGLARNYEELFVCRMLVGVGEAVLVPVAASLIADYFSPDIRPKAYGVFTTGSAFGAGAALILGGLFLVWSEHLIEDVPTLFGGMEPWQIVFILCGAPGIVLALIVTLTCKEPERKGVVNKSESFSFRPVFRLIGRHPRAFGCLMLGTVLNLVCVYAIIGWFPALFIRVHGWGAAETGWLLGSVGVPINIFAALNSGWVIVWLNRKGYLDAPMIAASVCAIGMVAFAVPASLVSSGALALVFYALNAVFVNWNISAAYSGLSLITPNEMRGQVMALQTIAQGLIALTAGNFFVGLLADTLFTSPDGISYALAVVFAVCGVGSFLTLMAGRKAFVRAAAEANANAAAAG